MRNSIISLLSLSMSRAAYMASSAGFTLPAIVLRYMTPIAAACVTRRRRVCHRPEVPTVQPDGTETETNNG